MAMLTAGVILGSVTKPFASGAGTSAIVLETGGPEADAPEGAAPAPEAPEAAAEPAALLPAPEAASETPSALPPEAAPAPAPPQLPPELPEEEALPEIGHVFLIVLHDHGYEEAFGAESPAPYLSQTLAGEGKLLANYYAVAQGGLANEVALLSGQGPTPQTAQDCPEVTPVSPGALDAEGQVEGEGCVFPTETETLPGQLADAELSWREYVEPGPLQAWRDPSAYFAGLAEDGAAAEDVVGLESLATDLKDASKTPSFSYLVPNSCHDGSDVPCASEQPGGLAGTEAFLQAVVPEITGSPAFKEEGGLIAITFDHSLQGTPEPDLSSCCGAPEYPNLPPSAAQAEPPPGPVSPTGGGGRVGMLLISPYVAAGTVEEAGYYNHFSFLRSVEELFGLAPLGYAAEPVLSGFDSAVFDASPESGSGMKR